MKGPNWLKTLKNFLHRFRDDEVAALGAQLTYYLILSFFPFLIFLITLVSYTPITREETLKKLSSVLPPNTYELVFETLHQTVLSTERTTFLSFGMIATIWTASRGVSALIRGINKAYDQKETRPFWKVKAISILFTLALALVILFSFILLVLGEVLGKYFFSLLGMPELFRPVWNFARYLILLLTSMSVFISIYYYIPNRRLSLREVLPGSVFAVGGWTLLSTVFSYYVNNFSNYSNTYGSIGGIIILLLWLYWNSIIILLGGELNATLAFDRDKKR